MYEANIEHEQVTMTLRDRLTTLESDAAKHSQVLALMTAQNKEKVDKLQEEKVMLEVGQRSRSYRACLRILTYDSQV